jgi:hypothetical protein
MSALTTLTLDYSESRAQSFSALFASAAQALSKMVSGKFLNFLPREIVYQVDRSRRKLDSVGERIVHGFQHFFSLAAAELPFYLAAQRFQHFDICSGIESPYWPPVAHETNTAEAARRIKQDHCYVDELARHNIRRVAEGEELELSRHGTTGMITDPRQNACCNQGSILPPLWKWVAHGQTERVNQRPYHRPPVDEHLH